MAIDRFDRVVEAFATAAVDPTQWLTAMETVSDFSGSHGALLVPITGRLPFVPRSPSLEPSFERYIEDGWVMRDERYRAVPAILNRGVATEFDFTTPEEMARHPYYQEFLAPFSLRWWAGVKFVCGEDYWCLSLARTPAQGPFSIDEQRQLADLSKRLSTAGALIQALGFARAESASAAFDASGTAVLLLDRFGKVIRANVSAEQVLGADVRIVNRRLAAHDAVATARLERSLHELLWRPSSLALMPPVSLPRTGRRPLLAYPMRLNAVSLDALGPCQAAVILIDLDRRILPPENDLRVVFGLTAAEARLAALMAAGTTLEKCSEMLGITKETARSQIKRLFSKTDTQRQAELVALLARLLKIPR